MNIYNNALYLEDIQAGSDFVLSPNNIKGKRFLISGATGLLGSFLVDYLMFMNLYHKANCTIYAIGRSLQKGKTRFSKWINDSHFHLISHDVILPLEIPDQNTFDYVLHLASNTHPVQYSTDPVGTIMTNILGLKNMLDFSANKHAKKVLFASSVEVYGENRDDIDQFDENYCGYINSNTLRAGYPESKRCGEALCQAYRQQRGLDVVIARLARSYGPTMSMNDSRAISQFILNGLNKKDIILKSQGKQLFSYTYMADAVYGILTILLMGKDGEAYNIADEESNITLKDLSQLVADFAGTKVVFDLPNAVEAQGFSKVTKSLMNSKKIKELGWKPFHTIKDGVPRTISILKGIVAEQL